MPLIRYPRTWTNPPRGRVLVLAPHADDETLGCGGAIARHSDQGDPVTVAIVSDGAAGDPEGRYAGTDYRELRRNEARAATEILGVHHLEFWELADQGLARTADLPDRIWACVQQHRPDIVYVPPAAESHPDHEAVGAAWLRATSDRDRVPTTYAYETWVPVRPTHVLDVTSVWERKTSAVRCYTSQLAYNDYLRAVEGLNSYRAIFLPSARQVEAFEEISPGGRVR